MPVRRIENKIFKLLGHHDRYIAEKNPKNKNLIISTEPEIITSSAKGNTNELFRFFKKLLKIIYLTKSYTLIHLTLGGSGLFWKTPVD